ncbi:MAG: desulfoferrodoxin [Elusimicrobiaceae bacterium]|nr:desulfoferrodoxin [Elusimicrobiaceae bacterium]
MPKLYEIYKCDVCGNITEVVHGGKAEMFCCGKPMTLQVAGTVEASTEKHIPVIEKIEGGFKVKVGEVEHPMIDLHYIEWIELITEDGLVLRKHLKPGDKPEAVFMCDATRVTAREYCNLHGLWNKEI